MRLPRFGALRHRRAAAHRRPQVECLEERWLMAVFTVTSAADSGAGTLRAAILSANAAPGTNTIDFAIGTGIKTIAPTSPLPPITQPLILDGTTQPGSGGRPAIEIYGAGTPGDGVVVEAPGTTVQGLVIDGFPGNQVVLEPGADGTTVAGNYIGLDPTGAFGRAGAGPGIVAFSNNNLIGGMPSTARNVISGNGGDGINLLGQRNRVINNVIGTDAGTSRPIGNGADGVHVEGSGNTIGGAVAGTGNIISGNRATGVALLGPGNLVAGNAIGVDSGGSRVLSNAGSGLVVAGAADNTIGGAVSLAANTISGNEANGIVVSNATGTLIVGNRIGTDTGGTRALGNGGDGLLVNAGASDTQVGGIDPSMRNLVAGNGANGVEINGASRTAVQGNAIGTDALGAQAVGNAGSGVAIIVASDNLIGGSLVGANLIRNNGAAGVSVASGQHNAILTNSIFHNGRTGIVIAPGANDGVLPPVLHAVTTINGQTMIRGMLFEKRKVTYLVQFFANTAVDPSGSGEGEKFLGQATIGTHHLGFIQFAVKSPVAIPGGLIITATATDPNSSTSEFSKGAKTAVPLTIKPVVVHHTSFGQAVALSYGFGTFGTGTFGLGTGTTARFPIAFGGFPGTIVPGITGGTFTSGLDTIGGLGLPFGAGPATRSTRTIAN